MAKMSILAILTIKIKKLPTVRGSIFEGPKSTYFWPFLLLVNHLQGQNPHFKAEKCP